jgi:hypothetical protein
MSDLSVFIKYVEKMQVSLQSDKNRGYLHDNLRTFMIRRRILPITGSAANTGRRKNHFFFSKVCPQIVHFITEFAKIW